MLLLDTCALIWMANGDPFLPAALRALRKAAERGELFLSPVSAWEIGVLASRRRLELQVPARVYVEQVFSRPEIQVAPLTPEIAVQASYLPGQFHSDPADRLIVSTAMVMGLQVMTRDRRILDYGAKGHVPVMAC